MVDIWTKHPNKYTPLFMSLQNFHSPNSWMCIDKTKKGIWIKSDASAVVTSVPLTLYHKWDKNGLIWAQQSIHILHLSVASPPLTWPASAFLCTEAAVYCQIWLTSWKPIYSWIFVWFKVLQHKQTQNLKNCGGSLSLCLSVSVSRYEPISLFQSTEPVQCMDTRLFFKATHRTDS